MGKVNREKFKVFEGVFDEFTLSTLEMLKRKKYFDELGKPIKTGKEGDVYYAYRDEKDGSTKTIAIKLYRITTTTFRKVSEHISKDFRYKNLKGNMRKTVLAWTQKEFRNMLLCHKNNVNVPYPYKQVNNVIIMEHIDGPMLKDTKLKDAKEFFEMLIEQVKSMLIDAKLIHGDLSEFNVLVRNEIPIIIDLGQALLIKNDEIFNHNKDLFERDIINITNYFNKTYKLKLNSEKIIEEILTERDNQ